MLPPPTGVCPKFGAGEVETMSHRLRTSRETAPSPLSSSSREGWMEAGSIPASILAHTHLPGLRLASSEQPFCLEPRMSLYHVESSSRPPSLAGVRLQHWSITHTHPSYQGHLPPWQWPHMAHAGDNTNTTVAVPCSTSPSWLLVDHKGVQKLSCLYPHTGIHVSTFMEVLLHQRGNVCVSHFPVSWAPSQL